MDTKPRPWAGQGLVGDLVRFVGAGVVNTALTIIVYELLLFVMSAGVAYAMTWLVGMAFVMTVYPSHVFKGGNKSLRARILTMGVYVTGFFIGLGIITGLDYAFDVPRLAIIAALAATTAFNFLGMRLVSRGSFSSGGATSHRSSRSL
jgi:putative flippase GtrA